MVRQAALVIALVSAAACIEQAPPSEVDDLGPACDGTEAGRACITLVPSATEDVRDSLADSEGALAWGLWEDGEVGPLGPVDEEGWVIAGESRIDLDDAAAARSVTIIDFEPGWYQVLAYFRPQPIDDPGEGDALTLPTDGFEAPADAHTRVDVILDVVR